MVVHFSKLRFLTGWCYWPVLLVRMLRRVCPPTSGATETQLGNPDPPNPSVDRFSCCFCRTSPASFASCSCLEEPLGGSCACYAQRWRARQKQSAWLPRLLHCCSALAFVPVPLPQVFWLSGRRAFCSTPRIQAHSRE